MQKHVYRIIILIFVFFIAIYLFGRNIKEEKMSANMPVTMENAKFPVISIQAGDNVINQLHGYSGNIEAKKIRDSMTPIDIDKAFILLIEENETIIKKIKYEVYDLNKDSLIDSGSISALEKTKTNKTTKIKIDADLVLGEEYAVKITATSSKSKKINYFTRVKVVEDGHLKEKLDFIKEFHNSILDKSKAQDIVRYIEPDYTKTNKNLAYVNIQSSLDSISFGGLSPKVLNDIIPTVKETNEETASVELSYMISSENTGNKEEFYNVKEFYRVRYTQDRMYLLSYERTMEAIFDMKNSSLSQNELKLGISGNNNTEIITNQDATKMSFVRERALWYYDLVANKTTRVFSFTQDKSDYIRDNYDQHEVKILDMDEEGNINFLIYGYLNRGDYEGRVGIVLYKFYPEEKRIEEQVYIPFEISYQVLKEDIKNFSYVNKNNVFYFAIDNVIYSYHMPMNNLEIIVSDVSGDSFLMSKEGEFIAWQNSSELKESKEVIILDLETGARRSVSAEKGYNIKVLSNIEGNLIYGFGKTKDIADTVEGIRILPLSKVEIVGKNGEILKEYSKKKAYVVSAKVEDNIIELERVVKNSTSGELVYQKTNPDFILNNVEVKKVPFKITQRVTEKALTELYISLPSGFEMKSLPTTYKTLSTIVTEDSTLRIEEDKKDDKYDKVYYVYALGSIIGSFHKPAEAIILANEKMGTVMNSRYQIAWERGGRSVRSTIDGIEPIRSGGEVSSMDASVSMLLNYNGIQSDLDEISSSKDPAYSILEQSLNKNPLNLIGCNLEEILYFVSNKSPVIAMKDDKNAILITGYDEFNITYIDPSTGNIVKKGLQDSKQMFTKAGNIFISYLN